MGRQEFRTVDVLRLEVETDPDGLVNLLPNPSGDLGGWGWVTPISGSTIGQSSSGDSLRYSIAVGVPQHFTSEPALVNEDQYVAASWNIPSSGLYHRVSFEWLDAAQALLSSSTKSGYMSGVGAKAYGPVQAPADTQYVRLRFDVYQNGSGGDPASGYLYFNDAALAVADDDGDLGTFRVNLCENPSFETDLSDWSDGGFGTTLSRSAGVGGPDASSYVMSLTGTASQQALYKAVGGESVEAGRDYTFSFYGRSQSVARAASLDLYWRNSGGAVISTSSVSLGTTSAAAWTRFSKTAQAPFGAASVTVGVRISAVSGSEVHYVDCVLIEKSDTLGDYIEGTVGSPDIPPLAPVQYVNILGPTHDIQVVREELNVGTLNATILDAALDPGSSDLIRPGRKVRLLYLDDGDWSPIFTGQILNGKVVYALKDRGIPDAKRARITLTAVDAIARLAAQPRGEGVATVDELPYVLEGCGVPWRCNDFGGQVPTATVVARNESASALDQIAITRDSSLTGIAWVDRYGVITVSDNMVRTPETIDGGDYSDLDIDYDIDRCVNEVGLIFLRLNPDTGETEEITYGPYRDEPSIDTWGVHHRDYTIQGIAEETSDLQDFAEAILALNSTPQIRVNSAVVPIRTLVNLAEHAGTDLYNVRAVGTPLDDVYSDIYSDIYGGEAASYDVVRVEHSITTDKWLMTLGFASTGSVAAPQAVPSPPSGAGGKTIGQLLRPVGEITTFLCAKVDIPAGWLPLDGSTFSADDYPELAAMLGGTTLPDFTDRLMVGAGSKALLATGGSPTVTLAANNFPHTHSISAPGSSQSYDTANTGGNAVLRKTSFDSHNHGGATGAVSLGSPTAVDILNPWVAVWPCVRAR